MLIASLALSSVTFLKYPILYFEELIKQISWVALAVIGLRFNKNEQKLFFKLFLFSIVLCSPLIFVIPVRYRAYFPHSNHLAYYTLIPLLFYLLFTEGKKKWLYVFALFIIVIITISSGGIAAFLGVLLLYFLLIRKFSAKTFASLFILAILMGAIGLSTGVLESLYHKVSLVDFDNIANKADRGSMGSESSLVWRMTYWTMLTREFLSHNTLTLLLGEGLKTMTAGNYIYSFMVRDPHNDYVRLIIERGFIGAAVYLFCLVKMALSTPHKILFASILFVPMFSGNIIVSFPFTFSYIILISMLSKKTQTYV